MLTNYETIIVGGGPAGSSCAWKLQQQGRQVLILDKQSFPRLKLCGLLERSQAPVINYHVKQIEKRSKHYIRECFALTLFLVNFATSVAN